MKPFHRLALLAALAVVAVGLRVGYLVEMRDESAFLAPAPDAAYHEYWARSLATGDWAPPAYVADPLIRATPFFRLPGYPYFLAGVYRVFGVSPWTPRIAQMCLGLASCIAAFLLGRLIFGEGTALVFAALMSCYWSFIYFESELLEPALVIALELPFLLLLVLWTRSQTFARAAAAGVILGALALVRSVVLPFAAVVPLWSWFVSRRQGLPPRRWTALTAVYLGSALLVISAATVRNAVVAKEFVLVSTNDGINLFLGNNAQANGMVASVLPDGLGEFGSCFDYPAVVRALERKLGRSMTQSEVSAYFRRQAWDYALHNPLRTAGLLVKKTLLFWGPLEVAHNREDELVRENSAVLRRLPGFPFALTTFVLGLGLLWFGEGRRGGTPPVPAETRVRQREAVILILAFIAVYFLTHLPFFVAGRYRVPIVPLLLLFGAYGLHRLGEAVVQGNRARAAAGLAAGAVLYLIFSHNFSGYKRDALKYYGGMGQAFARAGKPGQAIEAFEKALRAFPYSAEAHTNLGLALRKLGRKDEAARHFTEALQYEPDSAPAHANLGMIFQEQGRIEQACDEYRLALASRPDFAEVHVNYGFLLRKKGLRDEAKHHFLEAIRYRPTLVEAHLNLSDIYREERRIDLATESDRRAQALRPVGQRSRDQR